MDVRLKQYKSFCWLWIVIFLSVVSCGKQLDIDTQHGRDARIDEANQLLSKGYCQLALDTIKPLYDSVFNSEESTVITAAAYACFAGFNFITLADNISSAASKYKALAKSMPASSSGDGKIAYMYQALDALTQGNSLLSNTQRTTTVNSYMVFLQLATIGVIMSSYAAPNTTDGTKTGTLVYSNPRVSGEMTNLDACAVAAGISAIMDSSSAVTGNTDISSVTASFTTACTAAGYTSCTGISRDRTACNGVAAQSASVVASAIITAINSAW